MFETIIALTSTTTRKINSEKFFKTFSSYNWAEVQVELNYRPQKKQTGPFSMNFGNFNFNQPQNQKSPLESIRIEGVIGNSKIEVSCIFCDGTSSWFEAKIEGDNKNTIEIIEKQLTNIFKIKQ